MPTSFETTLQRALAACPKRTLDDPALQPAGIMVIVYKKDGVHCMLLNKRSRHVYRHKGEIAFPGGRVDPSDRSLLDTALRETHEEMGILPEDIRVLGALDDVATSTGFVISPYVGTIQYPYPWAPSEREVAEVLEIPLPALSDKGCRRDEVRLVNGKLTASPGYAYNGHVIWGATALVIQRFFEVLDGGPS